MERVGRKGEVMAGEDVWEKRKDSLKGQWRGYRVIVYEMISSFEKKYNGLLSIRMGDSHTFLMMLVLL